MTLLPERSSIGKYSVLFATMGGALIGAAEAARIAIGERLLMDSADLIMLLLAGGLGTGLLSGLAGLVFLVLPARPLGRVAWSAFLWGIYIPLLAMVGVEWFSDPPPFQDPFPLQGNPLAFGGVALGMLLVCVVLYQGLRGSRAVTGGAIGMMVALGAWVFAAGAPLPAATQKLPAGAPNVLVVTLDTTRADRFGAYGNTTVDTRHFDSIAREGALFRNATAVAAVTGPSHTTMFSGAGPWDHGVLLNGVPIPQDRPLISEILHDHGYATGAFVSAYVLDSKLGFDRGFGVYDDDFSWMKGGSGLLPARLIAMARRHADPDEVLERRGGDTVDEALSWMKQQDGSWYLWVHLFDAHGPYAPPPPFDTRYYQGDPTDPAHTTMQQVKNVAAYLEKSLKGITDVNYVKAQYDGEISYADAQLGRLLEAIDTRDTLVVVIADHGESLGEHDIWFNHGDDVYETSVHVPFAMRWPGRVPAGAVVEDPFEGTDLAPTILDIVGITPPSSMTGQSAVPALNGGHGRANARSMCFDRQANITERAAGRIQKPKYRLVGLRGPSSRYVYKELDGSSEYFDLSADPLGLQDVRGPVAATPQGYELLSILSKQASELFAGNATERSTVDLSPEERERLKALGYLNE